MTLAEKQKMLDVEKWIKSEQEGRDVCGEFDYCKFCDKNVENPCAKALNKTEKAPAKKSCAKKACEKKTCTKKEESKKPAKKTTKKK